ncbi:MAG: hypothetical protein JXB45_07495, partial [Candidatus Krumholzibacteriota bacterium]|nr:hypothetical protein [Candidatus Krumholzibacteriota bacterium]
MSRKRSTLTALVLLTAFITTLLFIPTASRSQETERERIKKINRELQEHGYHWTARTTSVSLLSPEEKKKLCGRVPPPRDFDAHLPVLTAPAGKTYDPSMDWRTLGGTTRAKNQGSCGSCWAFAATGQLESHVRIFDARIEDLSEQQIIDCNPYGSDCGGGWSGSAYYVMQNYGLVREWDIPYQARDDLPCTQSSYEPVAFISGYYSVTNDVNSIKEALLTGPVYTSIDIVDRFYDYSTGCFSSTDPVVGYHAVLIVGWDDSQCGGEGAWIIKNSWGTGWGQNGFGYVKYGTCNIGSGTRQIYYLPSTVFVQVYDPNGGEILEAGEDYTIKWTTSRETPDSLSVLLSLDGGANYNYTLASGLTSTDSLIWNVDNLPVNTARVKVIAYFDGNLAGYDTSDGDFTIQGLPRRYVSSSGGNIYPYSIPDWAAHSIQDAVDAAENGDTIMVAEDTYEENVGIVAPVYLLGGWNLDFTARDPELYTTTIQNPGTPVSFFSIPSGSCGIEGFTITGGTGSQLFMPELGNYGGGVVSKDADPIIKNNVFIACGYVAPTTFSGGGAIACAGGEVRISGNIISASLAQSGGGIYLYDVTGSVSGNNISGSSPHAGYSGYKQGGGICCLHSTLALANNVITGNSGYSNGGGIYSRLCSLTLNGDSIRTNECSTNGGGIYTDHSSLTIGRCTILENYAPTMGAGIYHKAAYLNVHNSLIAENDCDALGGGIYADSTWGGITNNTIDRNYAQYVGGNLYLSGAVSMDVRNNLITYAPAGNGFQCATTDNITFQYNGCYGNLPADI